MTFQEKIKKQLAGYKTRLYPGLPNGFWMRSAPPKELEYAFIPEDKYANLIKYYKIDFFNSRFYRKDKIKLHLYFHHMNSSQAMCINFFYPLFADKQLDLILNFLGFPDDNVNYKTVAYEKESHIDGILNYRPTNFDFYFETFSGKKFYFEIKYTEQVFGKATKIKGSVKFDKEHIDKFNAVYKHHLDSIKPEYQDIDMFLSHYQLMRNVIHTDKNSYVVFIYPNGNEKIKQDVAKAIKEIVIDRLAPNVLDVEWEAIFRYVKKNTNVLKLKEQMKEFEEKYFI